MSADERIRSAWLRHLPSPSRLVRNIGANLLGAGWNGVLIVAATPWFVSRLGLEAYGLLGFWLLMQMLLLLFDLGLGATLIREFANSTFRPDGVAARRNLLRTMEYVYWPVATVVTGVLLISAHWIATSWLNLRALPVSEAASAIRWMALALGLQYPCTLYTSGLAGLQKQTRMNALQMTGSTLRYAGGVIVLLWRPDPAWFFTWQALVSGSQTLATRLVLRFADPSTEPAYARFRMLHTVWRFSAGMAATAVVAVLLANVDRLVLSKVMPVSELGKYTVAFTATGLLQMGIQPFYRAYFPRFAELIAAGETMQLRHEYYQGCRTVAGFLIPAALMGWVFGPQLFTVWLGHADETIVTAFRWLLLGIMCAGLTWLPAAYQQAHGWTRLHATMIAGALCLGAPSLWWTTRQWGAPGATAVWVLHGVSDLTLGLWLMHRRLLPGELGLWYRKTLVPPIIASLPVVGVFWWLTPAAQNRLLLAGWLGTAGLIALAAAQLAGRWRLRLSSAASPLA